MLDHQDDLNADFRAFYGLDPERAGRLSGPEYLALATRTPAYEGVMRAVVMAEAEADQQAGADLADFRAPGMAELFDID